MNAPSTACSGMKGFTGRRPRFAPVQQEIRGGRRRHRDGLSLLEVVLALAILATALGLIGQLIRMGANSARRARDTAVAQLACESIMAEVLSGVRPPQSQSGSYEFDPRYTFSVDVQPTELTGLLSVEVQVQQDSQSARPPSATLIRWMRDPTLLTEDTSSADAGGV